MSGRGQKRNGDPDDWFSEPSPSRAGRRRRERRVAAEEPTLERVQSAPADDWIASGDVVQRRRSVADLWSGLPNAHRIGLVTVAVLVLLLIGLAVGGVFGGAANRGAITTTTRQVAPASVPNARPRVPAPARTLRPGAAGAQVKVLQRALTRLGYPVIGGIDGRYGPATEHAVARLQRASGLPADGIFGPRTLRALKRTLERATR